MLAIVAPGQGAQTPGFLGPWLDQPSFADRLNWLSAVSGLDLRHYGTEADAETIRDTAIAQPLLVAAGLLAALELFPHPADAYPLVGVVDGADLTVERSLDRLACAFHFGELGHAPVWPVAAGRVQLELPKSSGEATRPLPKSIAQ